MKRKNFEYFHKDIKQLKIDITFRFIFTALFIATFAWQIVSMVMEQINGGLSLMQGVVGAIVLISTMLLSLATFSYAFKDLRIISAIKTRGKCVSTVSILFSTKKTGFVKLYNYLIQFLTLVTSLVLVACITYSVLEVAYLSSISYYMPMLILICVAGYNSIYHVKDEILTQKTVQEQAPLY